MEKKSIFSDFNPVSAKAWKQKIQVDLKGAEYNESLLSNTLEGITIQPFYHKDTFKSLNIPDFNTKTQVCQTIFIDQEKKVNGIAKEVLQKGAKAIKFIADKPFKIKTVFDKLPKEADYLLFCNFYEESFFEKLISFSKETNLQIIIDTIHHFVSDGNWFETKEKDTETLKKLLLNKSVTIGINCSLYQNAGSNMVQQVAYGLAHANEYFNNFEQEDNQQENTYLFTFAVGGNYFFEIAKVRAFRYLVNKLLKEYQSKSKIKIILEPTLRNKTLYDYNVNLLRTTTESMSAMLSGADFVTNIAYDVIYHRSNEFGSRIARNQLLILQEESYFNKKTDISKGAYYIEQITYELAEKSLTVFKEIEKSGGFLALLVKGTIQRKIEESAQKEQLLFDTGKLTLLGTNKHPNMQDKMKDDIELYPFVKTKPRKTVIKTIVPRRLAEKLEKERLALEK